MTRRSHPTQPQLAQVCVIPFRPVEDTWEYCLITSLKKKRWIFPKGIVDPGETPVESALKEAWEEAGLRGEIVSGPVGSFRYEKWEMELTVDVLMMQVAHAEQEWPEAQLRQRVWLRGRETSERLDRRELREIFQQVRERLFHARVTGQF